MSEKKAILAVSFGTSFQETRDKTIGAIEAEIASAYPDYHVRRAFTSGMILRKLAQRDQVYIDNVEQAMERLVKEGFQTVIVQPTHIINGEEYEKMMAQLAKYEGQFDKLLVGAPLLSSSQDFEEVVEAVMKQVADLDKEHALVLMGHGTEHHTDAVYAALDYRFKAMGHKHVIVATVEGYPGIEEVKHQLSQMNPGKVILMPFMIVAGDHATNDLAGEEEDSWKSVLEAQGYQTECRLLGLGEMPEIREIYRKHLQKAIC